MEASVPTPRFEHGVELRLAGFGERFDHTTADRIPSLWQRFSPEIGRVPGQVDRLTYGLISNVDESGFTYLACVAVSTFDALPERFDRATVAPAAYAVFTHTGHVATLRRTMNGIWSGWLPSSAYDVAAAPVYERYDGRFDARTGDGEIEVWVPIQRKSGR
jgi:AraC family transcriptional regulator